jgi:hypothetical protein
MNGYPLEQFTNKQEVEKYLCGICKEVCRHSSVLPCGHLFCRECIEHAKANCNDQCPSCRRAPMGMIQDSPWHIQQINGSLFSCSNEPCSEVDALERTLLHEKTCVFRKKTCHLCSELFLWEEFDDHMGVCPNGFTTCLICELPVQRSKMDTHHDECPRVMIDCECGEVFERGSLAEHKTQCVLEPIPCRYRRYGCPFTCLREHMAEHEVQPSHMTLLLQEIERLNTPRLYPGDHQTTCHHHTVHLRSGLLRHSCDMCHQQIQMTQQFQTGVAYRCTQGCDFDICVSCFERYWRIPEAIPVIHNDIHNEIYRMFIRMGNVEHIQ